MAWTSRDQIDADRRTESLCVGCIVVVIVGIILAQLPGISSGSVIYLEGPLSFIMPLLILLIPFIQLGLIIRFMSKYSEETGVEN